MVETAGLPAHERGALERLVETSGFFALPARESGPASAHRDAEQFDLEIEDDAGRRHAVRLAEPSGDGALRDLLDRAWAAGDVPRTGS